MEVMARARTNQSSELVLFAALDISHKDEVGGEMPGRALCELESDSGGIAFEIRKSAFVFCSFTSA